MLYLPLFTYIYHKNQPNVGKYTSPMDGMGYIRGILLCYSRAVHWWFGAKDLEAGPRTALHCAAQSGHLEVDGVGFVFGNGHQKTEPFGTDSIFIK